MKENGECRHVGGALVSVVQISGFTVTGPKPQLRATCLVVLQLEEIDTSPKNDRGSEGDDEEEEGAKEGRDNSDEEKHQVELKKTQ